MKIFGALFGKTKNAVQEVKDENAGIEKEKTAKEEASLSRKGTQSIVYELETISYLTINKDYPKEKLNILKTGIQKIIGELKKADTLILDTTVIDDYAIKIIQVLKSGIRNGDEDTIKYTFDFLCKILLEERREITAIDEYAAEAELQQKNYAAEKMFVLCEMYENKGKNEQLVKELSADIQKSQTTYDEYRRELDELEEKKPELKLDSEAYIAGQKTDGATGDVLSYVNKNSSLADIADEIEGLKKYRAEVEEVIVKINNQIKQIRLQLRYKDVGLSSEIKATIDKYATDLIKREEERRDFLNKLEDSATRFYEIINTVTEDDRRRAAATMQRVKEIRDRKRSLAKLNEEAKREQELLKKIQEENTVTNNAEPTMIINN